MWPWTWIVLSPDLVPTMIVCTSLVKKLPSYATKYIIVDVVQQSSPSGTADSTAVNKFVTTQRCCWFLLCVDCVAGPWFVDCGIRCCRSLVETSTHQEGFGLNELNTCSKVTQRFIISEFNNCFVASHLFTNQLSGFARLTCRKFLQVRSRPKYF